MRVKTSARMRKEILGLLPIQVADLEASVGEVEAAAPIQSTWKRSLVGHAISTQGAMDGRRTIPRRNVTTTRDGKRKVSIIGETTMEVTLLRLKIQVLGNTM